MTWTKSDYTIVNAALNVDLYTHLRLNQDADIYWVLSYQKEYCQQTPLLPLLPAPWHAWAALVLQTQRRCEAQARERAYDKEIHSQVLQQIMNRLDRLELQPKAIPPSPSLQPAAPGFQPTLAGSTAGPPGGHSAPAGLLGHQPPAGLLGQHSTGPPPPSAMVSEVTDALSRISVAIDPSGSEVKGITLRPEYWVQHDRQGVPVRALNHARLTIPELMYGMFRVMSAVTDPSQKAAYEAHYKFLSECIIQDLYPARAYVNYDREVTNKIINGELSEYPACDLPSFALQLRKDKEKPQQGHTTVVISGLTLWAHIVRIHHLADRLCLRTGPMIFATTGM